MTHKRQDLKAKAKLKQQELRDEPNTGQERMRKQGYGLDEAFKAFFHTLTLFYFFFQHQEVKTFYLKLDSLLTIILLACIYDRNMNILKVLNITLGLEEL